MPKNLGNQIQLASDKNWLRFLVFIYGLAFCFLLVATLVTAYGQSHPELGLEERNPIVRDYISNYGLLGGLVLVNLYNSAMILLLWPVFLSYLILRRKRQWHNLLADSIVYAMMSAYGLCRLISWLFNAVNDVSWLLFYSCPRVITLAWQSWDGMSYYVTPAIFLVAFPIVYYLMRKEECV